MAALLAHESREYAAPSELPIPEVSSTETLQCFRGGHSGVMDRTIVLGAIVLCGIGCSRKVEVPSALLAPNTIEIRRAATDARPGYNQMVLRRTGEKLFVDEQPGIVGKDILKATLTIDTYEQERKPYLYLEFTDEGSRKMERLTGEQLLQRIAVLINGELRAAPKVHGRMGKRVEITGAIGLEEAERLIKIKPQ
jgi:hypothetical protein